MILFKLLFGKISSALVTMAVISAIGGGAYWYYTSTQKTILDLTAQKALLEAANDSLNETLNTIREQSKFQQENAAELQKKIAESEAALNNLRGILIDHDLTHLALKKPGLIEKRVNDGTKEVFDAIERDTTP